MFFKTLEIQGFKSFPDKTILSFDTKMTAVIGSNGNGKSNISDALRWVMGEQGAKTLRGDKMEDVIFHGTETRKQMGFAKVALAIDNTDRSLNVDSDEVVITRKLYRSGESEYLINGSKCRLKDIHEMLLGTGLGRDGYSIIGQGRVAEIVNSKGKERRETFDEAAGVSKFLHKKAEAERELSRANDNILRLMDIAKELEDRLPILERQSEKAVKAKSYLEKEKELEISLSIAQINKIDEDMSEIDNSILINEGECEHLDREILELETSAESKGQEKLRLSAKIDELRSFSENTKEVIAGLDKEAALIENEILHNKARIDVVNQQIENSKRNTEEYDKQISTLEEEISKNIKFSYEKKNELINKNTELKKITEESATLDDEQRKFERELSALYGMRTEAKIELRQAEEMRSDLTERLSEVQESIVNQDEVLSSYQQRHNELQTALDKTLTIKEESENKLSGYQRLYDNKKIKLEASKSEYENLRRQYETKKSRFDALSDVEKNMAGYYGSVKSVINASKTGRLSGIYGPVADIIHVEKRYSVAIEIALGAALQNIIVENEETAKRCIRFLKENNGGRATFLPITSVRGNTISIPALNDEEGFLGLASDLVKFDEKFQKVVLSVLGKTAVAEDIDGATYLAKKYGYKFRIVTLDGQVINAGGSFTGGSIKESAGIISRKQELVALENELQKTGDTLEIIKCNYISLGSELNKMSIEIEGYKEQIAAYKNDEIKLTAELAGAESLIHQCKLQQENSETTINRHKNQIAAQGEVIKKYSEILDKVEKEIEEKLSFAENIEKVLEERTKSISVLSGEISELNISALSLEKDVENLRQQVLGFEKNKENIGNDNREYLLEIEELIRKNQENSTKVDNLRNQMEERKKGFSDNQSFVTEIIEKLNLIERDIGKINYDIRDKISDKEKFSNALVLVREKKNNAEQEMDNLKSSLWEKYEISPLEAKNIAVRIENIKESKNQLMEIRRKINALGAVNFAAIDEFIEVTERYKSLSVQLEDVKKSKTELENLIAALTNDIKTKFLQSFNEINAHFGRIFIEIFGGGKAHLELTDPDNILNSGIEIFAAPPGKVIKNLISLSGGEQTMVAITIYFAILLHRPTPFCMLDEVDAALDDVNISKYIGYLKRFSDDTQLMIITHRRGTIEECDVLYGVYMQEKGVSRLLKQELSDEIEMEA